MTPAQQAELDAFIAERNEALRTLDMDYARRVIPQASSDEVRLLSMHKARYHCTMIDAALRRDSARWLAARGSTDLNRESIDPEGELPA